MFKKIKRQKGEIILIILLVMAVGLTIGLSVAGRSLTDIKLSTQAEDSSRAFSAAEAGIEEALKAGITSSTASYQGSTSDATYNVILSSLGNSSAQFTFPNVISAGDSQTIWLVPYTATGPDTSTPAYTEGTITVCWKDVNPPPKAALEASVFYKGAGDIYKIARAAYDPENDRNNGFDNSSVSPGSACTDGSSAYDYQVLLTFESMPPPAPVSGDTLIALRLRPVYAGAKIAVVPEGGASIPEQGKNIVSIGQTNSGVTRKWNVVQTYAAPQDIFDYAVWSNKQITK